MVQNLKIFNTELGLGIHVSKYYCFRESNKILSKRDMLISQSGGWKGKETKLINQEFIK